MVSVGEYSLHEQWTKTWLVRVYRGLHYPVIQGSLLNNEDSMESRRVFFRSSHGAFGYWMYLVHSLTLAATCNAIGRCHRTPKKGSRAAEIAGGRGDRGDPPLEIYSPALFEKYFGDGENKALIYFQREVWHCNFILKFPWDLLGEGGSCRRSSTVTSKDYYISSKGSITLENGPNFEDLCLAETFSLPCWFTRV